MPTRKRARGAVPFGPLDNYLRAANDREFAERVNVKSHVTIVDWRRNGTIPLSAADRAAVALGLHPLLLWPDFYERYSR